MAQVHFTVQRDLALPARVVFDELVDWKAHEDWVPLTKVEILSGEGGTGTEFIATPEWGHWLYPIACGSTSLIPKQ